jgi:hypothetical protein
VGLRVQVEDVPQEGEGLVVFLQALADPGQALEIHRIPRQHAFRGSAGELVHQDRVDLFDRLHPGGGVDEAPQDLRLARAERRGVLEQTLEEQKRRRIAVQRQRQMPCADANPGDVGVVLDQCGAQLARGGKVALQAQGIQQQQLGVQIPWSTREQLPRVLVRGRVILGEQVCFGEQQQPVPVLRAAREQGDGLLRLVSAEQNAGQLVAHGDVVRRRVGEDLAVPGDRLPGPAGVYRRPGRGQEHGGAALGRKILFLDPIQQLLVLLQAGGGLAHVVQRLGVGELKAEVVQVALGQHARDLRRLRQPAGVQQGAVQQHEEVVGGVSAFEDGLPEEAHQPVFLLGLEGHRRVG